MMDLNCGSETDCPADIVWISERDCVPGIGTASSSQGTDCDGSLSGMTADVFATDNWIYMENTDCSTTPGTNYVNSMKDYVLQSGAILQVKVNSLEGWGCDNNDREISITSPLNAYHVVFCFGYFIAQNNNEYLECIWFHAADRTAMHFGFVHDDCTSGYNCHDWTGGFVNIIIDCAVIK